MPTEEVNFLLVRRTDSRQIGFADFDAERAPRG